MEGRTAWTRNVGTPLREFLGTETGSAVVLLAATIVALIWVNVNATSYTDVWSTELSIRIGGTGISQDLQHWLNNGLMTFFFFVIGLEARREFDLGELRERRRFTLPLLAGLGGILVPIGIYLVINAGHGSTHGWGAAMSTDTAFALGMLALVGPRFSGRLRAFMLTVSVVDDVVALVVIATVYTVSINAVPLAVAVGVLGVTLVVRYLGVRRGIVYGALGLAMWVAMFKSGVDPVVVGLIFGLLTYAYPAARVDLERATDLFRLFREQPTPELARTAQVGLEYAISPNERLQHLYHPWSSYVIVPLFALANAGIPIDGGFLKTAFTSPVTLGILFGYVLGKPVGIVGASWLGTRLSRGKLRLPVGWAALVGGGAVAGIGFTVSLLISSLAFHGAQLQEAKLGVLSAAVCAALLSWLVFRTTAKLPPSVRARLFIGPAEALVDLSLDVDPERDHIRGPADAPVTLVEYGDFECPYCGRAEDVVRQLLADSGDVRYVWRHLPLTDVHPHAQLAAEASEAAADQGKFWEMHDLLFQHQDALRPKELVSYAQQLGLDTERFEEELRSHDHAGRIADDVDSADLSGVSGTPTFFINGRRHYGAYDIQALKAAVRAAKSRALATASRETAGLR
jgi:Na+/H+ antiporter NhaA